MRAVFTDRENQAAIRLDDLFRVEYLRWSLPGGSKEATLKFLGKDVENNIEQIYDGIGYGVDIVDDSGMVVWNGYVNEIEVQIGKVAMWSSLDQFANRVAIRYEDLKPSAAWSKEDKITDFVEDGALVNQYFKKEWIGYLPNGTPGQALNAAKTWLKDKGEIKKRLVLQKNEEIKVKYHLKGWWESLDWIFYKQDAGFVGHLDEGKTVCEVGYSTALEKIAQKFIVPTGGIKTKEVWLRLSKKLEPTDNVIVEIVADSGGNPGSSVLASGSIVGTELTGGYNWKRFSIGVTNLTAGGAYWLVVRRSGALSSVNYFLVATDDARGYAGGEAKVWNGSSWIVRNEDLNFAVLGSEETTLQIQRMVTTGGQFINSVQIRNASGVEYLLWRELKLTCKEEIENILRVGVSDGSKLDAMVDMERNLIVWKRKETAEWKMDNKGNLQTIAGSDWTPGMDWLGGVAETEFGEKVRLEVWEWWG